VGRPFFFRCGPIVKATTSTVIANPGHVALVDGRLIDVVNDSDVHAVHGFVVEEVPALPTSALITTAEIAIAIVHTAIKADDWPPIAFMENESAATPSPIGRGPEETRLRSQHPCPRDPVIITEVRVIRPISRRPDVVLTRAEWLFVNRQIGRRKPHRNADTDLCRRRRWQRQHEHSHQREHTVTTVGSSHTFVPP